MTIFIVACALLLAGAVKGLFGMGLPTVSMGLLALTLAPVQAASLLVIPTLVTNLWQLSGPGLRAQLQRFATLMIAMCVGTVVGVQLLTGGSTTLVSRVLGAVLVIYAAVGLLFRPMMLPAKWERWCSPVIGLISGVVNGATAIAAVPLVPYLGTLALPRDTLVQALGILFTTAMLALAVCLAVTGHLAVGSLGLSAVSLAPVALGMVIGQAVRRRLAASTFQRWFYIGLLVLGIYMIWRAS